MKISAHKLILIFVLSLGAFPGSAISRLAAQDATGNTTMPPQTMTEKDAKKSKKAAGPLSNVFSDFCGKRMSLRRFVVDPSGAVSDTGRTFEGPMCVEVFYNPIQSYVSLATATTTVNGPDLSKVTTGGTAQAGTLTKLPKAANISQEFALLLKREADAERRLNDTKSSLGSANSTEDQAIAEISLLRRTTKLRSPSQVIDQVKQGYKGLKDDLHSALGVIASYHATDKPGPNQEPPVLNELQDISDRLARLPLAYMDLPALDQKANKPLCSAEFQAAPGGRNELIFDPTKTESRNISWADWSAQCKAGFDQFKGLVDNKLADAKNYTDASDNTKGLKLKAAIAQYWDTLFKDMGLRTDMTSKQIDDQDISASFHARTGVRCGTLFNQTANTAVNLVVADLTPTLEGKDPEIKAQGAFVTVSCSTPFSLSAGVGFSTIHQQEFAIIKSSGGTGNPSVNTFGVISDSSITPMPIVMTNVRLWDWSHHKYAFHGSFGISGNLQNQASGGSTAEFLPAGTLSFWRTMYVSMGPQIGTKPELVGNFKVGDPVPSDITTINGQVKRTRTVGFGFAITFTKP